MPILKLAYQVKIYSITGKVYAMIKKSHRKKLDEMNPTPNESDVYKRCTKIGDLINKLFSTYFLIPEGYYRCPKCESQPTLRTSKRLKQNFIGSNREKMFYFTICGFCKGTGYIDFATNAMKPQTHEEIDWDGIIKSGNRRALSQAIQKVNKYKDKMVAVPYQSLDSNDLEIASSLFYKMYDNPKYLGFGLNFKTPNLNNQKNKRLNQFILYFIGYKKIRDKRKKFLDKNFVEFQKTILKKTKISNPPSGKILCSQCNTQPINIERYDFNDTIQIKICGKCYGRGYQSKRDTKAVIGFYISDASFADYSNKKNMIEGLLTDIDFTRGSILFHLSKIEYEEKQKKLGKKIDLADFMLSRLSAKSRASIDEEKFRHLMVKSESLYAKQ